MNRVYRIPASAGMCALLLMVLFTANVVARSQTLDRDLVATLGSTVPANGDVNPYGMARVPRTIGRLMEGQFLVSNFNNASNLQGTGTTIVQMQPNGFLRLFAQIDPSSVSCPGGVGLTTALVALRNGLVIVGSLPTTDGTATTAGSGCLLVLDSNGNVVETISGHNINGPWDMTAVEEGNSFVLFVTNVLNGTVAAGGTVVNEGSVVRLLFAAKAKGAPELLDSSIIGWGFPERTDPVALVIGPTGVAFDQETGNLLVADSLNNRIAAIPHALLRRQNAGTGVTISNGGALNDPLGISLVGHDLFIANGDDGNIVEVNVKTGAQVDVTLVDSSGGPPPGSGALFGLWALNNEVFFADDATNTFNLLH